MSVLLEVGSSVPLVLTVEQEGVGGLVGLTPTVAVRRGTTEYLDWDDSTFKPTGWVERKRVLTDVGSGHYATFFDGSAVDVVPGETLVAEYDTESVSYPGVDHESVVVLRDTDFLRKMATNRMEQTSGAPGQLTLFDDDGFTPIKSWEVRDEFGGGIAPQVGVPARRGAST
jgi:hypothetical protein